MTRTGLLPPLFLLVAATGASAQTWIEWGDFEEQQRCVWSCLANSPGADSAEYRACTVDLCDGLAGAYEVPAGEVPPPQGTPPQDRIPATAPPPPVAPEPPAAPAAVVMPDFTPEPVDPAQPAAPALPGFALTPDAPAGWISGETSDGKGRYAGVTDAATGARVDWLCGKGMTSLLAVSPFPGPDGTGVPVTVDVDGRVQDFAAQVQAGTAYLPAGFTAPAFMHIASGPAFAVADAAGQQIGHFTMAGATGAIGQAEGYCQFLNMQP